MPPLPVKREDLPEDRRSPKGPDDPTSPDPSQGEPLGEYASVDQDDPGYSMEDGGEGGSIVTIGEEYEAPTEDGDFYANLALVLPDKVLSDIATTLLKLIEDSDKEARKKRDEQAAEGIRRTGLGKDAPGGADFEGASKVVHPALTEACIDYEARVIKEMMPPSGPVKPKIVGAVTREKTERGKRKTEHMNWQITSQIKEARPVFETLLTQVPLVGAQYLHQWWDHRLKRPRWEFIPSDKCHYPFGAADWHSATRRTIEWTLSKVEYQQRIDQGTYKEIDIDSISTRPEQTKSEKATEKVAGVDDPGDNVDGDRIVYECMAILKVTDEMAEVLQYEQEDDLRPYLVSIDQQSKEVVGFYRDWEPDDEACEPIEHTYEFIFIPWRGAPVGFTHIIGGLSAAMTGALRALLDSALVANISTGAILKGSGTSGQTRRPMPGELVEIEGGVESDDIRKRLMQFQFNGPSPVLFQLLGFLVDAAKGTVRTSLDELASDQQPNTPVGTTMARVEEGLVVFSAVYGRVHSAFNRVLKGLHRLNRLYLPERLSVDAEGKEILVYRQDYEGPCDVVPTSDPTVYSDMQRYQQCIAVQQRAQVMPQLYKAREVEEWFLELLKIPDPKRFLQDMPQPHELNAVNENLALLMGQPVIAFPEQDHQAHLSVLLDFMQAFGTNPLIAAKFLPGAIKHAIDHMGYLYVHQTTELIKQASGGIEAHMLMSSDDKVKRRFDQLLAVANKRVIPQVQQIIAYAAPILQQAQMTLQKMQPPPPLDPGRAAIQASLSETQRKGASDQADNQIAQQKVGLLAQELADKRAATAAETSTKILTTQQDNQTAEDIATMRLDLGQAPGFSTGESMRGSP